MGLTNAFVDLIATSVSLSSLLGDGSRFSSKQLLQMLSTWNENIATFGDQSGMLKCLKKKKVKEEKKSGEYQSSAANSYIKHPILNADTDI